MRITDHAIVRYCERMLGLDVKLLKKQLRKEIKGDGRFQLADTDMILVVENDTLITILDKNKNRKRKKAKVRNKKSKRELKEKSILEAAMEEIES